MAYIYALKDPETRRIRYIGKAGCLKTRLAKHLGEKGRCPRINWISSLKSRGLRPEMEALLIVPDAEWAEWEIKFIVQARAMGMDLVNSNDGGGGVSKHSAESREKMSAALLLRGDFSPEHLANLSAAKSGKKHSAEHREANRASKLGIKHTAERCANNRSAQRSPEVREKKSAAQSAAIFSHHQFRRMPWFTDGEGI